MATPLYETAIKIYLRRMGEATPTFTYTNSGVTLAISGLKRITLDMIYDHFWFSGIRFLRIVDRISKGDLFDILKGLKVDVINSALTNDVYTASYNIYKVIDDVMAKVGDNWVSVSVMKERFNTQVNKSGLYALSVNDPKYYFDGKTKITIYPSATTWTHISFSYIRQIPRLLCTASPDTTTTDIWTEDVIDIITDGAIMYAKGDTNNSAVENMFLQRLNAEKTFYKEISTKQNNSVNLPQDIK